tara:strand:+ start:1956 stop:2528 length:573 start_codon:yes stop_codon:yes gene_type:complete
MKEQCDLGPLTKPAPEQMQQVVVVPEVEIGSLEAFIPPTGEEIFSAYTGFLRAFHLWFHSAHNVAKGTGFAGDHGSLYGPIYLEVQEVIDRVIEKGMGVFNNELMACPHKITSDAMIVLSEWESPINQGPERIAELALHYAKDLVALDEKVAMLMKEDGSLTFGLENLLAELADVHEGYVYLLNQRAKHL